MKQWFKKYWLKQEADGIRKSEKDIMRKRKEIRLCFDWSWGACYKHIATGGFRTAGYPSRWPIDQMWPWRDTQSINQMWLWRAKLSYEIFKR